MRTYVIGIVRDRMNQVMSKFVISLKACNSNHLTQSNTKLGFAGLGYQNFMSSVRRLKFQ